MVSYAIVFRHGLERYVADAKAAGVAGAIVPDLPVEEAGPLADICRREDFSLIQLITPTTPRDRALRIAERTTGFIYYVSVTGITGERTALPPEIVDNVAWLRRQTPLPICIGFGISRPEHVRMLAPVADGLIVGSAIVRRIAEAATKPREQVLDEIGDYAAELLAALRPDPVCSAQCSRLPEHVRGPRHGHTSLVSQVRTSAAAEPRCQADDQRQHGHLPKLRPRQTGEITERKRHGICPEDEVLCRACLGIRRLLLFDFGHKFHEALSESGSEVGLDALTGRHLFRIAPFRLANLGQVAGWLR